MDELDLHGVRHKDAALVVENFVAMNDPPFKIITGNSPTMKRIVNEVLKRYDLVGQNVSDWNLGAMIVRSK